MTLQSCDGCGVVLDTDKLPFPDDIYHDDGSVNTDVAVFDGYSTWRAMVECPVCGTAITKGD